MTETAIIEGCKAENSRCQRLLFDAYAPKMMSVCLRYAKNRAEAEDWLQEAFIRVFRYIGQYEQKGVLEAWLRRITVNVCLKNYRLLAHQNEQAADLTEYEKLEYSQADAFAQMGLQELLSLVNQLPEGYKVVFNLAAIEGYSHQEIGEILQITESTSRSQLSKAKAFLRKLVIENQIIKA